MECMTDVLRRAGGAIVITLVVGVTTASAQTQVRVTKDRATIWHENSPIIAAQVPIGTVLDVLGRDGEWYVVTIPADRGGKGEVGRIAASQVDPVPGGAPAPVRRPPPPTASPAASGQRTAKTGAPRGVSWFGFGQVGYGRWLAQDSFQAVLGSSGLPMFGGGGMVRSGGFFAEIAVERYKKSGERVFVSNGEVFKLGIADTITILPIYATVGYRAGGNISGYGGVGIGQYLYRETSDFSDDSGNRLDHFTSYHALAGVEFSGRSPVRVAVEVQYTTVPNSIGAGGASAEFGERNLGGVQARVKLLVGR
jgi:opacity protein-like surface antigen